MCCYVSPEKARYSTDDNNDIYYNKNVKAYQKLMTYKKIALNNGKSDIIGI